MKKKILLIFMALIVLSTCGCGILKRNNPRKKASADELVGYLAKGIEKGDMKIAYKAFPDFVADEIIANINEEEEKEMFDQYREKYGDDYKVTYEITGKEKLSDEVIAEGNEYFKSQYENAKELKECYTLDGTITIKGSKGEDVDSLAGILYCNFDGTWRLFIG